MCAKVNNGKCSLQKMAEDAINAINKCSTFSTCAKCDSAVGWMQGSNRAIAPREKLVMGQRVSGQANVSLFNVPVASLLGP